LLVIQAGWIGLRYYTSSNFNICATTLSEWFPVSH